MKKYHLLDHKWQKIGFALFAISVVICMVFWEAIIFDLFPMIRVGTPIEYSPVGHGWAVVVIFLLIPVSFVFMALSQEKLEDERIVETRHQILARIVIFFIVLVFIKTIVFIFLARFLSPTSLAMCSRIISYCTGVTAFIGYYVLFFKLSLWKQNRELSDEE